MVLLLQPKCVFYWSPVMADQSKNHPILIMGPSISAFLVLSFIATAFGKCTFRVNKATFITQVKLLSDVFFFAHVWFRSAFWIVWTPQITLKHFITDPKSDIFLIKTARLERGCWGIRLTNQMTKKLGDVAVQTKLESAHCNCSLFERSQRKWRYSRI